MTRWCEAAARPRADPGMRSSYEIWHRTRVGSAERRGLVETAETFDAARERVAEFVAEDELRRSEDPDAWRASVEYAITRMGEYRRGEDVPGPLFGGAS